MKKLLFLIKTLLLVFFCSNYAIGQTIVVDGANTNTGGTALGLRFGSTTSGEWVSSQRQPGNYRFGLEFWTNSTRRMSIGNTGSVKIGNHQLAAPPNWIAFSLDATNTNSPNNTTFTQTADFVTYSNASMGLRNILANNTNIAKYGIYNTTWSAPTNTATVIAFHSKVLNANSNSWAAFIDGKGFITSGPWVSSDAKLKKEVAPITNALDIIKKLNGKSYYFKKDEVKDIELPMGKQYGLIAQELEKIVPEAVTDVHKPIDKNLDVPQSKVELKEYFDFKAVNYMTLIPILIEAIKEQQRQLDAMQLQLDVSKK